ncbi:MAG: hypothetical protein SGPRY_006460, partial [Prymnesium sp.]
SLILVAAKETLAPFSSMSKFKTIEMSTPPGCSATALGGGVRVEFNSANSSAPCASRS